jgi:hypothetical protein
MGNYDSSASHRPFAACELSTLWVNLGASTYRFSLIIDRDWDYGFSSYFTLKTTRIGNFNFIHSLLLDPH